MDKLKFGGHSHSILRRQIFLRRRLSSTASYQLTAKSPALGPSKMAESSEVEASEPELIVKAALTSFVRSAEGFLRDATRCWAILLQQSCCGLRARLG